MKCLYHVEARWYVMAEDEQEAQWMSPAHDGMSIFTSEATELNLDPDWADVSPFGSDDDRTCRQILNAQKAGEDNNDLG